MANRDPLENPEPLIRRVYAYIAYRIGDGADAEHLTAATFERAASHTHTFDARRGDPMPWLIGIAARYLDDQQASPEAATLDAPAGSAHDLLDAVAMLSKGDRELVALRYGADLTGRQIADLLAIETDSVNAALHLLVQELDILLDDSAE